ncbi:hypothetical protein P0E39_13525 [Enterococcus faecalis]|uniref:hypothetical protein n=1 Tax=Enterococcus TaxID=1350 RepID=UPI0025AEE4D9|nr:hypothetical protein [Enterococcus faecalis]MDN3095756.1 hypothetical protein [Enterococcus faecalis]
MDLKFNIFGKSIYSLEEMELIQLAAQWFYDAGRLSSISWAQVTQGDFAVNAIEKIISDQSGSYRFGGFDKIFPVYIRAIKSSVEVYKGFCRFAPPEVLNKYANRLTMLEEILVKIKDDIEFFENNSKITI